MPSHCRVLIGCHKQGIIGPVSCVRRCNTHVLHPNGPDGMPARTTIENSSGTQYGCHVNFYGGSSSYTALSTRVFSTTDTYAAIERAVGTSATRNGTTIWNQIKTYDNVGNTLNLTTMLPTASGSTQTDSQSFCYDALNWLVWASNTGTPTGGDRCGSEPSGTTISDYQQSYSYDALDRLISGLAGTETYGANPTHTLSTIPNQYASYDAMGNMTCRNMEAQPKAVMHRKLVH